MSNDKLAGMAAEAEATCFDEWDRGYAAGLRAALAEIERHEAEKQAGPVAGLPERDTEKPAEQQGVFRKFEVRRVDGSDAPGGKHHGCEYFVLDVDHDPCASAALAAYADAVEATHPVLAQDMRQRYGLYTAPPSPLTEQDKEDAEQKAWTDHQMVDFAWMALNGSKIDPGPSITERLETFREVQAARAKKEQP